MEFYGVDYVRVYESVYIVNATHDDLQRVLEALAPLSVETFSSAAGHNQSSFIVVPSTTTDVLRAEEMMRGGGDPALSFSASKYELVEIGGQFIHGNSGLAIAVLKSLKRARVNIEYQVLNPGRFSILVEPRYRSRLIGALISDIGVGDDLVDIRH